MSSAKAPAKTKLTVRARGPLLVEGEFEIVGPDGELIELEGKKRVMLCRCGTSKTRPLCDGSHYRTNFECLSPPDEK